MFTSLTIRASAVSTAQSLDPEVAAKVPILSIPIEDKGQMLKNGGGIFYSGGTGAEITCFRPGITSSSQTDWF